MMYAASAPHGSPDRLARPDGICLPVPGDRLQVPEGAPLTQLADHALHEPGVRELDDRP